MFLNCLPLFFRMEGSHGWSREMLLQCPIVCKFNLGQPSGEAHTHTHAHSKKGSYFFSWPYVCGVVIGQAQKFLLQKTTWWKQWKRHWRCLPPLNDTFPAKSITKYTVFKLLWLLPLVEVWKKEQLWGGATITNFSSFFIFRLFYFVYSKKSCNLFVGLEHQRDYDHWSLTQLEVDTG